MRWKDELRRSVRTVEELEKYVSLSPRENRQLQRVIERHPMRVNRYLLSLIDWDDPQDPIRKMVVPSVDELIPLGSYDTSGELQSTRLPGLQHKYAQTALILATNRCATYCRYCFRKRLVGRPSEEIIGRFDRAARYIENHPEISNVLVSGGDPLILRTDIVEKFLRRLSLISHLSFIRFGSKTPAAFPERFLGDPDLLELFKRYSTKNRRVCISTQFNHPRELTDQAKSAVDRLIRSRVILNNQTVLLKGVNDDPEVLAELQNGLVATGVNPYYVFQCRPVKRVKHHFQLPLRRGYRIVQEARKSLNGYSKRFRYVMSHRSGKVEIVGLHRDEMYFRYHQARDSRNLGKFFKRTLTPYAGWLDDLKYGASQGDWFPQVSHIQEIRRD